jgi:hypothetical protein
MRIALVITTLLVAVAPAAAQFWTQYANARFGYSLDIPPGYEAQGGSDNGDGQTFFDPATTQMLTVWGGYVLEDFEAEVRSSIASADEGAWNITGETVTPDWAEFTAIKGMRALHQRLIAGCDGTAYAAFRLDYLVTDTSRIGEIIEGLTPTFLPPTNC